MCGFILALYENKQVARFKCAFVVYTSFLDIQKQMAVYHSQVNSLTFWGLWCVLNVIFCTVWGCYFFEDCLLRGTRITSTSTTWLSLMFVLGETNTKKNESTVKLQNENCVEERMTLKLVCTLSIINEIHILWNINIKQPTKNAHKLKFCFLSEGFSIKIFPRIG